MSKKFDEFLKEKDYLIKAVIKKLNIYTNYEEFYHVGSIALFIAVKNYDISKDNNDNFDVYAYYIILNHLKNELKRINKYQKLEMTIDLYNNELLAPIIEDDLIKRLEIEDLLKRLTNTQKTIIEYKKLGYTNPEIARKLSLSEEQVKYQFKLGLQIVKSTLNKLNIN